MTSFSKNTINNSRKYNNNYIIIIISIISSLILILGICFILYHNTIETERLKINTQIDNTIRSKKSALSDLKKVSEVFQNDYHYINKNDKNDSITYNYIENQLTSTTATVKNKIEECNSSTCIYDWQDKLLNSLKVFEKEINLIWNEKQNKYFINIPTNK